MAPPPEYDKEPKAPDKSGANISELKSLQFIFNELQANSDNRPTITAANIESEDNKHVQSLDDGQLKALLDEAITYKCPKDREGKSSLFKELLEEVEQDEVEQACSAAGASRAWPGGGGGGSRTRRGGSRGGGPRRALPHSNSLQDLVAALAAEPAPRRRPPPVSSRAHHGGSLPSGVDRSFLMSEEPVRGAEYVATVRCVNPSPLAERRVSASDAHNATEIEVLNTRRSKVPVLPVTYTARATLEIGSGSVCSGRAVTTTTASNQVGPHDRTPRLHTRNRPTSHACTPPATMEERHSSGNDSQHKLLSALKCLAYADGGGLPDDDQLMGHHATHERLSSETVDTKEEPRGPVITSGVSTEQIETVTVKCEVKNYDNLHNDNVSSTPQGKPSTHETTKVTFHRSRNETRGAAMSVPQQRKSFPVTMNRGSYQYSKLKHERCGLTCQANDSEKELFLKKRGLSPFCMKTVAQLYSTEQSTEDSVIDSSSEGSNKQKESLYLSNQAVKNIKKEPHNSVTDPLLIFKKSVQQDYRLPMHSVGLGRGFPPMSTSPKRFKGDVKFNKNDRPTCGPPEALFPPSKTLQDYGKPKQPLPPLILDPKVFIGTRRVVDKKNPDMSHLNDSKNPNQRENVPKKDFANMNTTSTLKQFNSEFEFDIDRKESKQFTHSAKDNVQIVTEINNIQYYQQVTAARRDNRISQSQDNLKRKIINEDDVSSTDKSKCEHIQAKYCIKSDDILITTSKLESEKCDLASTIFISKSEQPHSVPVDKTDNEIKLIGSCVRIDVYDNTNSENHHCSQANTNADNYQRNSVEIKSDGSEIYLNNVNENNFPIPALSAILSKSDTNNKCDIVPNQCPKKSDIVNSSFCSKINQNNYDLEVTCDKLCSVVTKKEQSSIINNNDIINVDMSKGNYIPISCIKVPMSNVEYSSNDSVMSYDNNKNQNIVSEEIKKFNENNTCVVVDHSIVNDSEDIKDELFDQGTSANTSCFKITSELSHVKIENFDKEDKAIACYSPVCINANIVSERNDNVNQKVNLDVSVEVNQNEQEKLNEDTKMSTELQKDGIEMVDQDKFCDQKANDGDASGCGIVSREINPIRSINYNVSDISGEQFVLAEFYNNAFVILKMPQHFRLVDQNNKLNYGNNKALAIAPAIANNTKCTESTNKENNNNIIRLRKKEGTESTALLINKNQESNILRRNQKMPTNKTKSKKESPFLFYNLQSVTSGLPSPGSSLSIPKTPRRDVTVDSSIPFSCITTPEVVTSCNTTSSTSQAAVAADSKTLQLGSNYPAVASVTGAAPPPQPRLAKLDQPRSVIASSYNGMPLTRPNYGSTSSSTVDDKKSLDENGNSVQGYNSPHSGSSQVKKNRKKKTSKNETVINIDQMDGYQGDKDLNELLRFIESDAEGTRGHKLGRVHAKHKDDGDDKGKKRSTERRVKDKDSKPKRANSMEELSRTKLEDLTDRADTTGRRGKKERWTDGASSHSGRKSERRSWGDDSADTFFFADDGTDSAPPSAPPPPAVPANREKKKAKASKSVDSDATSTPVGTVDAFADVGIEPLEFQTVTKKRKPRRRCEEAGEAGETRAAGPERRRKSAPPSDKSNDSNDDMDSVHSLPAEPAPPRTVVSYADIARTRHNIPDLIESCNFYADECEPTPPAPPPAPPSAPSAPAPTPSPPASTPAPAPAPTPGYDAEDYPALETRARRGKGKETKMSPPNKRIERRPPDVVSERRPAVILLDEEARPGDMDGVTFGFDVNEQLLCGGGGGGGVCVRAGRAALRYLPPADHKLHHHLHQIVHYIGTAWEDIVRCGNGKVRYFSE